MRELALLEVVLHERGTNIETAGTGDQEWEGRAGGVRAGGRGGPKGFDPAPIAAKLHLWWEDGDGGTFIIGSNPVVTPGNGNGDLFEARPQTWSRWPEKKIINELRLERVRLKAREGEQLSEADRVLQHTMKERRLEMSIASLAGYPAGIHDMNGMRCLVRTSPRLVVPKEGEWGTVKALIDAKLDLSKSNGPNQVSYFHGWMKIALEGLYQGGPGNFRPGQCCVFAGPRDSGKSRLQHQVITGLLGGRSADPGPYLFGRTDFNGEMFSAEHLMMEDPASGTKTIDRVFFGEMLKQLVVNDTQRLHRKREDAMVVSPFFRTTISINDDPDKMRVLPLLTRDLKDKVMLFLISDSPLPVATTTLAERAEFRRVIAAELPAYAWWLLNVFEIEPAQRSVRFGVKEWHHPGLATELFDDTPAAELLQLIDAATFSAGAVAGDVKLWDIASAAAKDKMGEQWEGSAVDLERMLLSELDGWKCSLEREAKKICVHNKVDRLLSRLKEDAPDRVLSHRTRLERRWIVLCPPE